jgi:membrane protease YdiL (CAAX protease family)
MYPRDKSLHPTDAGIKFSAAQSMAARNKLRCGLWAPQFLMYWCEYLTSVLLGAPLAAVSRFLAIGGLILIAIFVAGLVCYITHRRAGVLCTGGCSVCGVDAGVGVCSLLFVVCSVFFELALSNIFATIFSKFRTFASTEPGGIAIIAAFISKLTMVWFVASVARGMRIFDGDLERTGNSAKKILASAVHGFAVTYPCIATLGYAIMLLIPGIDLSQNQHVEMFKSAGTTTFLVLLFVRVVVFAPIIEEILFRGFLYKALKCVTAPLIANAATALVFAAFHLDAKSFIQLFVFGVFMGMAYERSGDIREPIIIHSLFNFTNSTVLALLHR